MKHAPSRTITGQRAGKITKSLGYIEERIISIAALLDGDTYKGTATTLSNEIKDDKLLEGPSSTKAKV